MSLLLILLVAAVLFVKYYLVYVYVYLDALDFTLLFVHCYGHLAYDSTISSVHTSFPKVTIGILFLVFNNCQITDQLNKYR